MRPSTWHPLVEPSSLEQNSIICMKGGELVEVGQEAGAEVVCRTSLKAALDCD